MRNRGKHENKFVRPLKGLEELREPEEEWCTREEAKEVIDDLNDEEFTVVTNVLGHLFLLDEDFPTEDEVCKQRAEIAEFLKGKKIEKVEWSGWPDEEPLPYLKFTDGTFLELIKLVHLPSAILFDWGREEGQ